MEIFLIKWISAHKAVPEEKELWQEQKQAAKKLQQRTYNVTQTSTRRSVAAVVKTVTLVDSPLTLSLHVLRALRVDESLVAEALRL